MQLLLGKCDEAVTLLEAALPLSRGREEVLELGAMLGQAQAQVSSIAALQTVGQ